MKNVPALFNQAVFKQAALDKARLETEMTRAKETTPTR
jgi:hypothetical protein